MWSYKFKFALLLSFGLTLLCSHAYAEGNDEKAIQTDLSAFDLNAFQSWGLGEGDVLERAITHPAGLPYFRLMTTIAPGQNSAQIRVDVEGISVRDNLNVISNILSRTPPSQIRWENLFLIWNTFLPDSEGVDVMRMRNVAIELQDADNDGSWGDATLRQKVHNFPNSLIVNEIADEIRKTERMLGEASSQPDKERIQQRLDRLKELHGLESRFWFGSGLTPQHVQNFLDLYNANNSLRKNIFTEHDTQLEKIQKITDLRERLLREFGVKGKSMRELMESGTPLPPTDAHSLVAFLAFDRKLSNETMRLLSQVAPGELQQHVPQTMKLLERVLELEHQLTPAEAAELKSLSNNPRANLGRIRTILGQPIADLQSRYSAMQTRFRAIRNASDQARDQQNQLRPELGHPERLVALGDNEVRQSILFNLGAATQAILRENSEPLILKHPNSPPQALPETEVILPIRRPVNGRIIFVSNESDLRKAHDAVASGENVILVKLTHYDVDLPAVDLLITTDPTLNQASHMALLAKSAGIGHLNIVHGNSPFLNWLRAQHEKEIQIAPTPGKPFELNAKLLDDKSARGASQDKVKLDTKIDEKFAQPVALRHLLEKEQTECSGGQCLSGGKGRGLSIIEAAAEKMASHPNFGIPDGVQIPYGLFREWFRQIDLLPDWEKALKSGPNSVNWERVVRAIRENHIPSPVLRRIIQEMGGTHAIPEGWFVRSNSNSEDGGFNGAGINKTIPDVRNEESLAEAIKEVFIATYDKKARTWWHRIFQNPEAVRSSVLLAKTVPATHSSVAILSADGKTLSIDSLPGIGENVVGGSAIAERMILELDPATENATQESLINPASATRLKMWTHPDGGGRTMEEVPLIYQGRVLNPTQRAKMAKFATELRHTANSTPEFRGKPLDLEIAWVNNEPHLVQIREAPSDPPPVQREARFVYNPAPRTPDHPTHELSVQRLIQDIVREFGTSDEVPKSTQLKIALLSHHIQVGTQSVEAVREEFKTVGGESVVEALKTKARALFHRIANNQIHIDAGLIQMEALTDMHRMLPIHGDRDSERRSLFSADEPNGASLINDLKTSLTKHYHPEVSVRLINLAQQLIVDRANNIHNNGYEWPRTFFAQLPTKTVVRLMSDHYPAQVPNQNTPENWVTRSVGAEIERLTQIIRRGNPSDQTAAHRRLASLFKLVAERQPTTLLAYLNNNSLHEYYKGQPMADPTVQNEFRTYKEQIHQAAGYPDETNRYGVLNTPRNKEMARRLIEDPVRLRALLLARENFIEHLISGQEQLNKDDRSPSRVVEILSQLSQGYNNDIRTYRRDLIERARRLLNESGFKVDVHYSESFQPEISVTNPTGHCCTLTNQSFRPLNDLLHSNNLNLGQMIPTEKRNDQGHLLQTSPVSLRASDVPSGQEVAESPAKLIMLLNQAIMSNNAAGLQSRAAEAVSIRLALPNARLETNEWNLFFAFYLHGKMTRPLNLPQETWKELERMLLEQIPAEFSHLAVRDHVMPRGMTQQQNYPGNTSSQVTYEAVSPDTGAALARLVYSTTDRGDQIDVYVGSRKISVPNGMGSNESSSLNHLLDTLFHGRFSALSAASPATHEDICARALELVAGRRQYRKPLPPKQPSTDE